MCNCFLAVKSIDELLKSPFAMVILIVVAVFVCISLSIYLCEDLPF